MDPQKTLQEMNSFTWYHKIDLGKGIVTPGLDFDPIWNNIRESRKSINYSGKNVLDIASYDGMWAFEAEKLGANLVVATDCYYENYKKILFCHKILNSQVIPYYNVSPYNLYNRLDVFFEENWGDQKPYDRLFDVVQHLGLLYHLRDPMISLSQSRSVIRTGGYLLIETAAVINEESSCMIFNGVPPNKQRIYADTTTWWAPTITCLKEMLRSTLFEPIEDSIRILDLNPAQNIKCQLKNVINFNNKQFQISRVSMVAKAIGKAEVDDELYRELARTYRNPGLEINHIAK